MEALSSSAQLPAPNKIKHCVIHCDWSHSRNSISLKHLLNGFCVMVLGYEICYVIVRSRYSEHNWLKLEDTHMEELLLLLGDPAAPAN